MEKYLQKWSDITGMDFDKLKEIIDYVKASDSLSEKEQLNCLNWFFLDLQIDPHFFRIFSAANIGNKLVTLSLSRLLSDQTHKTVEVDIVGSDNHVQSYMIEDSPNAHNRTFRRILGKDTIPRFEIHNTQKDQQGTAYSLYTTVEPEFRTTLEEASEFKDYTDKSFFQITGHSVQRYERVWNALTNAVHPVIEIGPSSEASLADKTVLTVGVKESHTHFLYRIFHLFSMEGLQFHRGYGEQFLDGKHIFSFYLTTPSKDIDNRFLNEVNDICLMPQSVLEQSFYKGELTPREVLYALSAEKFTHQFLTGDNEPVLKISEALANSPQQLGLFRDLSHDLTKSAFSTGRILAAMVENTHVVSALFKHFEARMSYKKQRTAQDIKIEQDLKENALDIIDREISSFINRQIFRFFVTFNDAVLKTNFFSHRNSAISYRLRSDFLDEGSYHEKPHGIFLVLGNTFVGFHIRFREIARGGIRMVVSRNQEAYNHNLDTLFDENYGLANTQQMKNKDIPEGGAKGVILLNMNSRDHAEDAFQCYIDAVLDIIHFNNDNNDDTKKIEDYLGQEEILFFGPDEGSAEFMDWASNYAKQYPYPFWKAISTGKSPARGGIPHDVDGMTTRSVHQFVLGVLDKLGLREEDITKVQTGGPDGDLGSNELLISKDKTKVIIDGSGVIYDPKGLNRKELHRLAKKRCCVNEFDQSKLNAGGFFVSIDDRDITLPDGEAVVNGEVFRNNFHLSPLAKADLLVPCGGRPGTININNWKRLLDENNEPKFKVIVEGANLFITEQARFYLEEKGVVLFKDASTNKGGVTSSSLEVLASLALSDQEYDELMICSPDTQASDFRRQYIKEIIDFVEDNARKEFDLLWDEHQKTGKPYTLLTNEVSNAINSIADQVRATHLPQNATLRRNLIERMVPATLLQKIGLETLLQRVPESYLNAMIATYVATTFVYENGLDTEQIEFYEHLTALQNV